MALIQPQVPMPQTGSTGYGQAYGNGPPTNNYASGNANQAGNPYYNQYTTGTYSSGYQPPGNNYPAGIYGSGQGGSGTAVGLLTPEDLTSNNLNKLIDQNGQYIQQARNQAIQQSNSRGGLNSSIAAGNAQGAAIQAALPIAADDAQAALGLQSTNLNNLSHAETANIAGNAQVTAAGTMASAQEYSTDANNYAALQRQRENLAFSGEQNQLGYERSLGLQNNQANLTGMWSSYLSNQGYQQNLGLDQFNLGATLLQGNMNFADSAGLYAMQDPAIMGDPAALGGFIQFIGGPYNNIIDRLFGNLFGNGQPQQGSA
jgi:hypothetical protein